MNSRETVRQALAHRAGRVPVDFGGTSVTGLHVSVVEALRRHYGLPAGPVRVFEFFQMLGEITDDLREAMGVDTVGALPRGTMFGFPAEGPWREWRCPWGQVVLVPPGFQTRTEANGDVFIFPAGDRSVPPSGHMPASSFFFDGIIRQDPIDEDKLDPTDNLEEYGLLTDQDLAHWRQKAEILRGSSRAVVANMGGTGLGDIARVPGTSLRHPRGIRDVSEWYMSIVARRDYVRAVFDRQYEIALENLARFHAVMGDVVDVLFICGTDFGTQASQFCSVGTFEDLYLPFYRKLNEWVHHHTAWKTMKHSCGAIDPLLPSLIRAGFDIINPVQCSAAGMDPEHLKRAHGRELVFWGGGVDTQKTLPFGTPAEVRTEVLNRLRIFSRDGGFVFNAIHNIQARTPTANFLAMLDAVKEFNRAG